MSPAQPLLERAPPLVSPRASSRVLPGDLSSRVAGEESHSRPARRALAAPSWGKPAGIVLAGAGLDHPSSAARNLSPSPRMRSGRACDRLSPRLTGAAVVTEQGCSLVRVEVRSPHQAACAVGPFARHCSQSTRADRVGYRLLDPVVRPPLVLHAARSLSRSPS